MKKLLSIAILDDNQEDAQFIERTCRNYYKQTNFQINLQVYYNPLDLLKDNYRSFDILFLDIEMPSLNGIELAKKIRETNKKCFISFVTNYSSYVYQSYDVHAFGFLNKPLEEKHLFQFLDEINSYMDFYPYKDKKVSFETFQGTILLNLHQILYLEYFDKLNQYSRVVKLHTKEKDYIIKDKLTNIYQVLPQEDFIIPHKSFIVNLYHIKMFKQEEIILSDHSIIPVSQKRSAQLRSILHNYMKGFE